MIRVLSDGSHWIERIEEAKGLESWRLVSNVPSDGWQWIEEDPLVKEIGPFWEKNTIKEGIDRATRRVVAQERASLAKALGIQEPSSLSQEPSSLDS